MHLQEFFGQSINMCVKDKGISGITVIGLFAQWSIVRFEGRVGSVCNRFPPQ